MFASVKPVTMYKDYSKDVKDMLTKSYMGAQKWKVESKFKAPKNTLVVNPVATSDGRFTADVEYVPSQCNATLKATLDPTSCDATLNASYRYLDHKVEGLVKRSGDFELFHEFVLPNRMTSHAKLVKKALEMGLSAAVAPHCQVGCGAYYQFDTKQGCDWTVTCRYANAGHVLAVRTNKLQSYTTSVLAPVPRCPHRVVVGAEVVCSRGAGWTGTLGLEMGCVFVKGNTLKARVNKRKEWAVAYIANLADGWTAAISLDKNLKPGVLLTHS